MLGETGKPLLPHPRSVEHMRASKQQFPIILLLRLWCMLALPGLIGPPCASAQLQVQRDADLLTLHTLQEDLQARHPQGLSKKA